MTMKFWSDVACATGMTMGLNMVVEYFRWYWPNVFSHRVFLLIIGIYVLTWGIIFFVKFWGMLNFTSWSTLMAVVALAAGVNSLIGAIWLWWVPPSSSFALVVMGMSLIGWDLYYLLSIK